MPNNPHWGFKLNRGACSCSWTVMAVILTAIRHCHITTKGTPVIENRTKNTARKPKSNIHWHRILFTENVAAKLHRLTPLGEVEQSSRNCFKSLMENVSSIRSCQSGFSIMHQCVWCMTKLAQVLLVAVFHLHLVFFDIKRSASSIFAAVWTASSPFYWFSKRNTSFKI